MNKRQRKKQQARKQVLRAEISKARGFLASLPPLEHVPDVIKQRLVRGSEVSDYLRCRRRWYHKWVMNLKPKRQDGKLFFGNLFHKFVEVYYQEINHDDPWSGMSASEKAYQSMEKMFKETNTNRMDQVELDEVWDLALNVTQNYVRMWYKQDVKMNVIATEFTFAIPLANGIVYTGTIDLIYLDEEGRLWFSDHKTTIAISKYVDKADMDRQISRYFWALQQLAEGNGYVWVGDGWIDAGSWISNHVGFMPQPHGFIYNIVLKDYPEPIEPLKKGGISVAKAQKTTYDKYLGALLERGFAVMSPDNVVIADDKYLEMLNHLKNQEDEDGNKFFRRMRVYRQPEELDAAIQEFYATAVEMVQMREKIESGEYMKMDYDPLYRNITDDCGWDCGTKGLCQSTMDGSSGSQTIAMFYEKEESQNQFLEVTV